MWRKPQFTQLQLVEIATAVVKAVRSQMDLTPDELDALVDGVARGIVMDIRGATPDSSNKPH